MDRQARQEVLKCNRYPFKEVSGVELSGLGLDSDYFEFYYRRIFLLTLLDGLGIFDHLPRNDYTMFVG